MEAEVYGGGSRKKVRLRSVRHISPHCSLLFCALFIDDDDDERDDTATTADI
jgi:hypothetical protein